MERCSASKLKIMDIKRPQSRVPMPPDAKLVFKGVIFDMYQWQQEMFDGSYQTFEKLKRPDTTIVVPVLEDGNILITYQKQPGKEPYLGMAGGQIEEGEDVLEAAKRELLEETGYVAGDWRLWMAKQPYSKIEWVIYTLIAIGCKKTSEQHLDVGERIEVKPVAFEEFVEVALDEKFQDMEIKIKLLEAKAHPEKMEDIKKLLLGK